MPKAARSYTMASMALQIQKGPQRAPRGATLNCKDWHAEAALRMLLNNLDPEVGEDPESLIVYGGSGKAARSWEACKKIVETLQRLQADGRPAFDPYRVQWRSDRLEWVMKNGFAEWFSEEMRAGRTFFPLAIAPTVGPA